MLNIHPLWDSTLLPESQTCVEQVTDCSLGPSSLRQATFYQRTGKRILDLSGAVFGLIALAPFLGVVALAIKATSSGPVFFPQMRIGKNGQPFQLVKFRSMVQTFDPGAPSITVRGDSRITHLGTWLRRTKIDELPQLWNVIKGDMSLVGPRPEVENYVKYYSVEEREVLRVRPGITDPASIAFRHEEVILAQHANPEQYYRSKLLHDKLTLNLVYIDRMSLFTDLQLLLSTIRSLFI